jgi:hypothetical protein
MQAALERDVGRELQTTPGEAQMPACPANGIRSMLMLAPGCSPLWLQSELTTSPDAITNSGGMPTFGEQVSAVNCGGPSALSDRADGSELSFCAWSVDDLARGDPRGGDIRAAIGVRSLPVS